MKYRKKPVIIEAQQWDGTAAGASPIIDWMLSSGATARFHEAQEFVDAADPANGGKGCPAQPARLYIDTFEGTIHAIAGDYIIRGVQGEFYPCKPDIFEATYEALPATSPTVTTTRRRTQ